MKSFFTFGIVILLLGLGLTSCEEEGKVCDDCQDAIDHMFHKIEQNGCNPDNMGDAMSRLREDCGQFPAEAYAGVMAHSCSNENHTRNPECHSVDDDVVYSFLKIYNVLVDIRLMSTRNADDSLKVELAVPNGVTDNAVFPMEAGSSADYFIPSLDNGEMVDIIITAIDSDDVILQKSITNKFWRTGYWSEIRTAQVVYLPLLDAYDVVFTNW